MLTYNQDHFTISNWEILLTVSHRMDYCILSFKAIQSPFRKILGHKKLINNNSKNQGSWFFVRRQVRTLESSKSKLGEKSQPEASLVGPNGLDFLRRCQFHFAYGQDMYDLR